MMQTQHTITAALVIAVLGWGACKNSDGGAPRVAAAKALAFAPGTGPSAIRSALKDAGAAGSYDETLHVVRLRIEHPWFSRVTCHVNGETGVSTECVFGFRDGVLKTQNIENLAARIEKASPAVGERRRIDTDKLKGSYYYEFAASGSNLVTLYVEWKNGDVSDGHVSICPSVGSEDHWPECKSIMQALVTGELPAI